MIIGRPETGRDAALGGTLPFQFEDFVLDPERRELRRGGELIALEPQVFDLLVYLVRNRERVVTKDDLLDTGVVRPRGLQSTLTSRINAARRAIGDSGEAQRLIRTSPRKGFRFVGDIRGSNASGIAAAASVSG